MFVDLGDFTSFLHLCKKKKNYRWILGKDGRLKIHIYFLSLSKCHLNNNIVFLFLFVFRFFHSLYSLLQDNIVSCAIR